MKARHLIPVLLSVFLITNTQASWLDEIIKDIIEETDGNESDRSIPTDSDRMISVVPKIGVVGDSISDEYSTYPYGIGAINWVLFLEKTKKGELGGFKSLRMYPRLYGYQYNWARAGATTADLIAEHQHTGLASQIETGKVEVAVILIGSNDIREIYGSAYKTNWTQKEINHFVDGFKNRMSVIIDTIYNSGPKILVVATVPDLGDSAEYQYNRYPDESKRQKISHMITSINEWILKKTSENNTLILDLHAHFEEMAKDKTYRYHGLRVDTTSSGVTADHFFAIDGFHPGSIPQSRIANQLLIQIEDERVRLINDRRKKEAEAQTTPSFQPIVNILEPKYNTMTPAEIFKEADVSPSAEIYFPQSGYTSDTKRVIQSPWFGVMSVHQYPWINHENHGWLYCEGYGGEEIKIWDSHLGWLYTSPKDYPTFLRVSNRHMLRYKLGSAEPRRFFDETSNEWIEIPYSAPTK